jgi:hypothetical protein
VWCIKIYALTLLHGEFNVMLGVVALSILLTWVVCAVVAIGIGSFLFGQFGKECALTDAFWTGMTTVVAILEVYHLIRPIDLGATTVLACLGILGLFQNRHSLLAACRKIRSIGLGTSLSYAALIVMLALRSAGPCEHYDTGLYGASAVRWATTYPVVPGLANLQGRLGFNSSVFLCIATLEQGVWHDLAHHLFVGLIVAGLLAYLVPAYFRLFRGTSISSADWFMSILLIPAVFWTAEAQIVGSMTDVPAAAACFAAVALLLRSLHSDSSARDNASGPVSIQQLNLVVAMSLFALAIVFKLSTAAMAGLGWIIAFLQLSTFTAKSAKRKQLVTAALLLSAAILLPWIARGLVLSGYPLFPKAWLGIPVDWQVPRETANWESAAIQSWARMPHARFSETQGFRWIGSWVRGNLRNREGIEAPFLLAMAGGLAGIVAFARRKTRGTWQGLWLLVPSLVGCLFWFSQAPDPRFGEAAIWTTAATLGTLGAVSFLQDTQLKWRRFTLLSLAAISVWCLSPRALWRLSGQPLLEVHGFLRLPVARIVSSETLSGLVVYRPAEGDQCWDAQLLCTPSFNNTLRLRQPGNMRSGFVSNARSEMPDLAGSVPSR